MSSPEFRTKICSHCKVEQHISFFYFDGKRYVSWCKACQKDASRSRRAAPLDHDSTKFCVNCGETKSITEYYSNGQGGRQRWCKKCHVKRSNQSRDKRVFGVSQRGDMISSQENRCAICNIEFNSENFKACIDHNAITGKVRAILCTPCNVLLGMHRENCETLRSAGFNKHAEYLEHYMKPI